jgi:hypothetical protein
MQLIHESAATVYTVGISDPDDPDRNPGVLKRIASLSGGECFLPGELEPIDPRHQEPGASTDAISLNREGLADRVHEPVLHDRGGGHDESARGAGIDAKAGMSKPSYLHTLSSEFCFRGTIESRPN